MITETKVDRYEAETIDLLVHLHRAGFEVLSVENGGPHVKRAEVSLADFLAECMACDEANLYVRGLDGKRRWLWLVYGNGPGELVADSSVCAELETVLNAHYERRTGGI